jgi:endonuclease III
MARQSERRSHLDLQGGMLSERELTTILKMLRKLCQHNGVNVDSSMQEVQSFTQTTDVDKLASELEDKLPEEITMLAKFTGGGQKNAFCTVQEKRNFPTNYTNRSLEVIK